jgi:hypothetical protein
VSNIVLHRVVQLRAVVPKVGVVHTDYKINKEAIQLAVIMRIRDLETVTSCCINNLTKDESSSLKHAGPFFPLSKYC